MSSSDAHPFEPIAAAIQVLEGSFRRIGSGDEPAGPGFRCMVPEPETAPPQPLDPVQLRQQLEREIRAEMEAELARRLAAEDQHFLQLAADLASKREEYLRQSAKEAAQLALAVARRILRREIDTDPDSLIEPIRSALWKLTETTPLVLRVHPDDADRLRANPTFLAEIGAERIDEDRRIQRGGCLIEREDQALDLRIDSQLEEIQLRIDACLEPTA